MAKYDHKAINQTFVAPTDEGERSRTVTQTWLDEPKNIERILDVVASGQSLRRFCEREGLSYSAAQRRLTGDELISRYHEAQEQQGEHLLGEMERITKAIEGKDLDDNEIVPMDPKAGQVILENLRWRISKFNARRFSDRQVIEQHTYDHTKAHIEAVRALAGAARRPAIEGQVVRPALTLEEPAPGSLDALKIERSNVRS